MHQNPTREIVTSSFRKQGHKDLLKMDACFEKMGVVVVFLYSEAKTFFFSEKTELKYTIPAKKIRLREKI
jgi:hypothetical protein